MFRFIEKRFSSRICKLICGENTFVLNTQSKYKHVTAIYYHYYLHIEIINNGIDEKKKHYLPK